MSEIQRYRVLHVESGGDHDGTARTQIEPDGEFMLAADVLAFRAADAEKIRTLEAKAVEDEKRIKELELAFTKRGMCINAMNWAIGQAIGDLTSDSPSEWEFTIKNLRDAGKKYR